MTEKRYYQRDFEDSMSGEEIVDLLNENDRLKQFQTNTFTLINEMIETSNHYRKPIKSIQSGDDLGYWNGVYQKLKELRSILENEEIRK